MLKLLLDTYEMQHFKSQNEKKYVLITGASSGIGLATTKLLAENDFFVIAAVHSCNGLKIIEKLNKEINKNILPIILDVTNFEEIKKQFTALHPILNENGLICLINNAGIATPGPIEFITPSLLNQQFQVNLTGVLAITQTALPYLRKAQGKVINVGSISGRYVTQFLGAYSSSKFALRALTQTMRLEFELWNIDVTYIEAGNIKTPIWDKGIESLQKLNLENSSDQLYYKKKLKALINFSKTNIKHSTSPDVLANFFLKCLTKKKLKPIYSLFG